MVSSSAGDELSAWATEQADDGQGGGTHALGGAAAGAADAAAAASAPPASPTPTPQPQLKRASDEQQARWQRQRERGRRGTVHGKQQAQAQAQAQQLAGAGGSAPLEEEGGRGDAESWQHEEEGGADGKGAPGRARPSSGAGSEESPLPDLSAAAAVQGVSENSALTSVESRELLSRCQGESVSFCGFDAAEIEQLAEDVSLLRLNKGEHVMRQGERAAFVALIVQGSADIVVGGARVASLGAGSMVGEMAVFKGGLRTADVVVASPDFVVATFLFEDLVQIHSESPMLGLKLSRIFAHTSLTKLRLTRTRKAGRERVAPVSAALGRDATISLLSAAHAMDHGLGDVTQSDIAALAQHAYISRFSRGDRVLSRGQTGRHALFVLEGVLEERAGDGQACSAKRIMGEWLGEELVLGAGEASGIGAFDMLFSAGGTRARDVFAQTDCTVAVLTDEALAELSRREPAVAMKLYLHWGNLLLDRVAPQTAKDRESQALAKDRSVGTGASWIDAEEVFRTRKDRLGAGAAMLAAGAAASHNVAQQRGLAGGGGGDGRSSLAAPAEQERSKKRRGRGRRMSLLMEAPSDCDLAEAVEMLHSCRRYDGAWRSFSSAELERLAEAMIMMRVDEGEHIVMAGEAASFVGVIAVGSADVCIGDKVVATAEAGMVVGEMAVFRGGVRSADVVSSNSSTIIGAVPLAALETLNARDPELALQLLRLCVSSSASKLQHTSALRNNAQREHNRCCLEQAQGSEARTAECTIAADVLTGPGALLEQVGISKEDALIMASYMWFGRPEEGAHLSARGEEAECTCFVLQGRAEVLEDGEGSTRLRVLTAGDSLGADATLHEGHLAFHPRREHDAFAAKRTNWGELSKALESSSPEGASTHTVPFEPLLVAAFLNTDLEEMNEEHPEITRKLFMALGATCFRVAEGEMHGTIDADTRRINEARERNAKSDSLAMRSKKRKQKGAGGGKPKGGARVTSSHKRMTDKLAAQRAARAEFEAALKKSANDKGGRITVAEKRDLVLVSEYSREDVQEILRRTQCYSDHFRGLNPRELTLLAGSVSVLVLEAGDQLMAEGERASFLALVTKGDIVLSATGREIGRAGAGDLLGEPTLFEPAGRAATAVAGDKGATVAVLEYSALEAMNGTGAAPLRNKLVRMLAHCIIGRLRTAAIEEERTGEATGERFVASDCPWREKVELLRRVNEAALERGAHGLGKELTDEEAGVLAHCLTVCDFKDSDHVVAKGRVGDSCLYILEGELEARVDGRDSRALGRRGVGDFVGERAFVESTDGTARRTADMFAVSETVRVAVLTHSGLLDLNSADSALASKLFRHLSSIVVSDLAAKQASKFKEGYRSPSPRKGRASEGAPQAKGGRRDGLLNRVDKLRRAKSSQSKRRGASGGAGAGGSRATRRRGSVLVGGAQAMAQAMAGNSGRSTMSDLSLARVDEQWSAAGSDGESSLSMAVEGIISDACTPEEAEALLATTQSSSRHWHGFTEEEVRVLAADVAMLRLSVGEHIMRKGETASFVGLLVRGEADVLVNGNVVASVKAGEVLGEMALFEEGGVRNADVVCTGKGSVVATMPFDELDAISKNRGTLGMKLLKVFARTAASKLNAAILGSGRSERLAPTVCVKEKMYRMMQDAQAHASKKRNEEHVDGESAPAGLGDDLSPQQMLALSERFYLCKMKAGQCILKKGGKGSCAIFVLEGTVEAKVDGPESRTLGWRSKGELVGENAFVESYIDPCKRNADVYATTDVSLAVLTQAALDSLAAAPSVSHRTLALALLRRFAADTARAARKRLPRGTSERAMDLAGRLLSPSTVARSTADVLEVLLRTRGVERTEAKRRREAAQKKKAEREARGLEGLEDEREKMAAQGRRNRITRSGERSLADDDKAEAAETASKEPEAPGKLLMGGMALFRNVGRLSRAAKAARERVKARKGANVSSSEAPVDEGLAVAYADAGGEPVVQPAQVPEFIAQHRIREAALLASLANAKDVIAAKVLESDVRERARLELERRLAEMAKALRTLEERYGSETGSMSAKVVRLQSELTRTVEKLGRETRLRALAQADKQTAESDLQEANERAATAGQIRERAKAEGIKLKGSVGVLRRQLDEQRGENRALRAAMEAHAKAGDGAAGPTISGGSFTGLDRVRLSDGGAGAPPALARSNAIASTPSAGLATGGLPAQAEIARLRGELSGMVSLEKQITKVQAELDEAVESKTSFEIEVNALTRRVAMAKRESASLRAWIAEAYSEEAVAALTAQEDKATRDAERKAAIQQAVDEATAIVHARNAQLEAEASTFALQLSAIVEAMDGAGLMSTTALPEPEALAAAAAAATTTNSATVAAGGRPGVVLPARVRTLVGAARDMLAASIQRPVDDAAGACNGHTLEVAPATALEMAGTAPPVAVAPILLTSPTQFFCKGRASAAASARMSKDSASGPASALALARSLQAATAELSAQNDALRSGLTEARERGVALGTRVAELEASASDVGAAMAATEREAGLRAAAERRVAQLGEALAAAEERQVSTRAQLARAAHRAARNDAAYAQLAAARREVRASHAAAADRAALAEANGALGEALGRAAAELATMRRADPEDRIAMLRAELEAVRDKAAAAQADADSLRQERLARLIGGVSAAAQGGDRTVSACEAGAADSADDEGALLQSSASQPVLLPSLTVPARLGGAGGQLQAEASAPVLPLSVGHRSLDAATLAAAALGGAPPAAARRLVGGPRLLAPPIKRAPKAALAAAGRGSVYVSVQQQQVLRGLNELSAQGKRRLPWLPQAGELGVTNATAPQRRLPPATAGGVV